MKIPLCKNFEAKEGMGVYSRWAYFREGTVLHVFWKGFSPHSSLLSTALWPVYCAIIDTINYMDMKNDGSFRCFGCPTHCIGCSGSLQYSIRLFQIKMATQKESLVVPALRALFERVLTNL